MQGEHDRRARPCGVAERRRRRRSRGGRGRPRRRDRRPSAASASESGRRPAASGTQRSSGASDRTGRCAGSGNVARVLERLAGDDEPVVGAAARCARARSRPTTAATAGCSGGRWQAGRHRSEAPRDGGRAAPGAARQRPARRDRARVREVHLARLLPELEAPGRSSSSCSPARSATTASARCSTSGTRGPAAPCARRRRPFRPDVVHLHNVARELSASVFGVPGGAPAVHTFHDHRLLGVADGQGPAAALRALKGSLDLAVARRRVDVAVGVSEPLADDLQGRRVPPRRAPPADGRARLRRRARRPRGAAPTSCSSGGSPPTRASTSCCDGVRSPARAPPRRDPAPRRRRGASCRWLRPLVPAPDGSSSSAVSTPPACSRRSPGPGSWPCRRSPGCAARACRPSPSRRPRSGGRSS